MIQDSLKTWTERYSSPPSMEEASYMRKPYMAKRKPILRYTERKASLERLGTDIG